VRHQKIDQKSQKQNWNTYNTIMSYWHCLYVEYLLSIAEMDIALPAPVLFIYLLRFHFILWIQILTSTVCYMCSVCAVLSLCNGNILYKSLNDISEQHQASRRLELIVKIGGLNLFKAMYYIFGYWQRRHCYERLSEHYQKLLIHKVLKCEVHFFAIYIAVVHHDCR